MILVITDRYWHTIDDRIAHTDNELLFVGTAFSFALIPLSFYVLIKELLLRKKHEKKAKNLNSRISENRKAYTQLSQVVSLQTHLKKGDFKINQEQLLFIESKGNYSVITYVENSRVITKTLRVSLKDLEKQLAPFKNLVRSHRSYIVNKANISNLSGNARGYYVRFEQCLQPIPISRSFDKEQLSVFASSNSI